jgi:predicted lipoprotein with Yx(FWY)xxD motif
MLARSKAAMLVAPICAALLLAGCGGSSTSAVTSSRPQASGAPTGPVAIKTVTGRDGTYLTDRSGRALYMWVGDDAGKSNCSGDCALAWPPVVTASTPSASGGARSANVGTITRSDGGRQVTYKGHPLYYFVVDSGPGTTKGQGSDSFGARWWLVAPSGAAITVNGSSSVSPPTAY